MYNLLLVEDDNTLGYILKEYLVMNDFNVMLARDGAEGLKIFTENQVHLCILDIMMPKIDGFELSKKIKETNQQVPFIFLTAKSLKVDKLKGFKIGADDYLVKPIDEEELLARINVILRRTYEHNKPNASNYEKEIADFSFNPANKTLYIKDKTYTLTEKETALLKLLIDYQNRLLNRDVALKNIWQKNDYFNRRSMDVHISKLRKFLSQSERASIINIHGRGYMLEVKP